MALIKILENDYWLKMQSLTEDDSAECDLRSSAGYIKPKGQNKRFCNTKATIK